MPNFSTLHFSSEAGVATITLDRPDRLNAFNAVQNTYLQMMSTLGGLGLLLGTLGLAVVTSVRVLAPRTRR